MTHSPTYELHSTWPQALTLHERGQNPAQPDTALAERRLRTWRAQSAYADDATFARYLAAEDLSVEKFVGLLGEDAVALCTRHPLPPTWVEDLTAAYATPAAHHLDAVEVSFLMLAVPLIEWASAQLRRRLDRLPPSRPFSFDTADHALRQALVQQLPPLIERTLVLELHVARLQNLLVGETPEARFLSFIERLRDPAHALAVLAEYPVLARQLANKARQSANAVTELCERLTQDHALLEAQFRVLGTLSEIDLGAGDTHRDGRSVAILRFEDGVRLVYKPRSLAVDRHFQDLLLWLNQKGIDPPFRPLAVLDRNEYGWVEFLTPQSCTTIEEIERFYMRQGGYLALLYVLNAADFHFENLIAVGEHPMLIDLEALFHPNLIGYDPNNPALLAQQALDQSVLSIGMLPQRLRFYAGASAIDVSGIAAAERQLTPDKMPVWEDIGTDEMRLVRRHVEFSSTGHRPDLAGQAVDVRSQDRAIAHGFEQVYRLLWAHCAELTADDGPLAQFADVEIRVVARSTREYSLLLQESSHPDLLRHAPDRDRLYSRLWRDLADTPQLVKLLPAERRDLHNGDVPIFLTRPASRHLWDSQGACIADFLPESGLDRVRHLLATMNEEDLARQIWYIHASFATLDNGNRHTVAKTAALPQVEAPPAGAIPSDFQRAACAIGDRLVQLAHRHGDKAIWIGLGLDEQNAWSLNTLTLHLYDGHAGVALFLAYLGDVTGDRRYTKVAEAALATMLIQAAPLAETFPYLGDSAGGVG